MKTAKKSLFGRRNYTTPSDKPPSYPAIISRNHFSRAHFTWRLKVNRRSRIRRILASSLQRVGKRRGEKSLRLIVTKVLTMQAKPALFHDHLVQADPQTGAKTRALSHMQSFDTAHKRRLDKAGLRQHASKQLKL